MDGTLNNSINSVLNNNSSENSFFDCRDELFNAGQVDINVGGIVNNDGTLSNNSLLNNNEGGTVNNERVFNSSFSFNNNTNAVMNNNSGATLVDDGSITQIDLNHFMVTGLAAGFDWSIVFFDGLNLQSSYLSLVISDTRSGVPAVSPAVSSTLFILSLTLIGWFNYRRRG